MEKSVIQSMEEIVAMICAGAGLIGLLISGVFAFLFHLGVRDFQDYEYED